MNANGMGLMVYKGGEYELLELEQVRKLLRYRRDEEAEVAIRN